MQLRLSPEEVNFLSNLMLENHDFAESHADLIDKVLARDLALDSDSLELLAAFLMRCRDRLRQSVQHHEDAREFDDFESTFNLLDRLTEKVDEACAMI